MEFQFRRTRIDKISREKILEELKIAAKKFNYTNFGKRDFDKISNISSNCVMREFGTWKKALAYLNNLLEKENLSIQPRFASPNQIHSDKECFDEMERVWKQLGHRPSKYEWHASNPKISYGTFQRRFNGWTNACLKFIEYKMGHKVVIDEVPQIEINKEKQSIVMIKKEDRREIPLKLRLDVLNRDNFRCIFCGQSPAISVGVVLHIDHIHPFAKGGKTILDNLQTLCSKCNLGKSDRKLN